MTLWGGRFDGEASAAFSAVNDSLRIDHRLVQEDVEGSVAWAAALEGVGVLTAGERETITEALQAIGEAARTAPKSVRDGTEEDVHTWVEARLIERVGDLGKKLHTGRSRNDQVATDLRLWTRRQIAHRKSELRAVQASLLELAERESDTVMPGYTHLQRAQPILFAHWCLAHFEALDRDLGRLGDAARRMAQCPLGAGALAGTAYAIDRHALASKLGFAAPTANSLDAVSDRDFVVETLAASVLCGLHLSRLAEDLVFFATSEAGFVEIDDSVASGSSLMPQKKNPDSLELIRGKAGRLLGALTTTCMMLKGLPLSYNKDLQEDKEALFDAMDTLGLCLRVLPRVLDGLIVDRVRTKQAAQGGYANATELADYLVAQDVPFRQAHEQVGRIVRHAMSTGVALEAVPVAEMTKWSPKVDDGVLVHLTLDATLAKRDVYGGTAPNRVHAALIEARGRHENGADTVTRTGTARIRSARIDDLDAISTLVDYWYEQGENLPRSREEILAAIRDFAVAEVDGRVVGCGCLYLYGPALAEIRSVGVDPASHGHGLGSSLVEHLVGLARSLHLPKVFVLTRAPQFFGRLGFATVPMESLPEKTWKDCERCARQSCCDETPMVRVLESAT